MIQLVYVSSATREMSEDDLLYLLDKSRSRNKRQNVTGMLLYAGGNFFQVLEGDKKDVEEIFKAIVIDERNKGSIEILKEDIIERTFPSWSMGFKHLTSQNNLSIQGYTEFQNRKMQPDEFANKPDMVLELLYRFKSDNT
jgi:hypothetical protein